MTRKFGRNYRLTIYPIDGGDPIIISLPFTVKFTCIRNINASVNQLGIDIYNLSEAHRARIFQDLNVLGNYDDGQQVNPDGKNTRYFNILLEAGYSTLYRIFYGRMLQASSAREGTNIITRIDATSSLLDVAGSQTITTLQSGQTVGDIINYLIGQFPNLKVGAIGNFKDVMNRPVVLNGNTWELLKEYSGNTVYIDNDKVYALNNNEALDTTFVIDDAAGLLETPRRQFGILLITTLMETGIDTIGQLINLQSTVQREFNGTYKVIGIQHQGTISSAVSGDMRSLFTLQAQNLFNGFTVIPLSAAA